jgi:hypothetical protein
MPPKHGLDGEAKNSSMILKRFAPPTDYWGKIAALAIFFFIIFILGWLCPFYYTTGIPCPGCFMTRAIKFLITGDFGHMLLFHPFAPVIVSLAIGGVIYYAVKRTFDTRLCRVTIYVVGGGMIVFWLYRLIFIFGDYPFQFKQQSIAGFILEHIQN